MTTDQNQTILVTGITGYLGTFCAVELARRGYRVRGSLRDPKQQSAFRALLAPLLADPGRLELVPADLTADAHWDAAIAGCDGILHVASPFPASPSADPTALVEAAQGGTLRVLAKAAALGVERVVMTSSLVAMVEGWDGGDKILDESSWGIPATDAYARSKILAEQAAWRYVNEGEGRGRIALTTLLPGLLLGPLLSRDFSTSIQVVLKLVRREFPGLPALGWHVVDVRDVAAAHVDALVAPGARGQRLACAGEFMWLRDMATVINGLPHFRTAPLPLRAIPDVIVRLLALFDPQLKLAASRLRRCEPVSDRAIRELLGWKPRPVAATIADTVESIMRLGLQRK